MGRIRHDAFGMILSLYQDEEYVTLHSTSGTIMASVSTIGAIDAAGALMKIHTAERTSPVRTFSDTRT